MRAPIAVLGCLAVALAALVLIYPVPVGPKIRAAVYGRTDASLVYMGEWEGENDELDAALHHGVVRPANNVVACEVRVKKPLRRTFAIPECDGYELVADESGNRLAWGPRNQAHRLVYFGSHGRSFDAPADIAGPVAWADVPTLADELPTLARATLEEEARLREAIFPDDPRTPELPRDFGHLVMDEVRDAQGSDALGDILISTTNVPVVPDSPTYVGLWERAFAMTEPKAASAVRESLRNAVSLREPGEEVLARALHVVDLSAPSDDAMLTLRALELMNSGTNGSLLGVLLRRLAKVRPRLACDVLSLASERGFHGDERSDELGAALLVLAATHTPCAAVDTLLASIKGKLDARACDSPAWFCPESDDATAVRRRCSAEELSAGAAAHAFAAWPELQRPAGSWDRLFAYGLAYTLAARGPLSPTLERLLARQSYAWRPDEGRPCSSAPPGQACTPHVSKVASWSVCVASPVMPVPDHPQVLFGEHLLLRFDDATRERWIEHALADGGSASVGR